jgi:hypothetical protein
MEKQRDYRAVARAAVWRNLRRLFVYLAADAIPEPGNGPLVAAILTFLQTFLFLATKATEVVSWGSTGDE